jgi:hypothetical protein
MSWLFSQALVEEYLGDTSLDGEQSAPSNGNPTQQAYCAPDKMTDFSRLSQFGMTFAPLTENLGEALLMWYLAAFHAKTLAQQEKAQESTESDQECGEKWRGSFTKYDPDSSSWKTHQCSLLGDLESFSETWPRWGLMRDGECWEQPMLALRTSETESGSLQIPKLPTPVTSDANGAGRVGPRKSGNISSLKDYLSKWHKLAYPPVNITEYMMGWPLGWTDLKPLAMDKFQQWLEEHGRN